MFNKKLKDQVKMQGELINALVETNKSISKRLEELEDKVFAPEPKYFGGK